MKKRIIALTGVLSAVALVSCGGAHGDNPGRAYMPDMYYSRAYEAYRYNSTGGEYDSLNARGITYNGLPVAGTVARGDMLPTHLTADSLGIKSADGLKDPLDSATANKKFLKESERLYLVNCAICHGTALDGNGPLWKNGDGPFPAKPQVLNDANAAKWTDGHIYYIITFGKNAMGPYASNLRPEQRWAVVKYIRSKQTGPAKDSTASATPTATASTSAATGTAKSDSSKTRK